jgi:hypothetical protein
MTLTNKERSSFNRQVIGVAVEQRRGGINNRVRKPGEPISKFDKNLQVTRYGQEDEETPLSVYASRQLRVDETTAFRRTPKIQPTTEKEYIDD